MTMTDNTQRFTGKVEAYERYRQRYPAEEILAILREWCGLTPANVIADVGAGTGMLADVFLDNGNRVLAIEPNADMRAAMTPQPNLEIVDATAEETTLPAGSVDMVTAGRAFHWFKHELALPEFERILKPGGWVVLVSLGRDDDGSSQMQTFGELIARHNADFTQIVRAGYRIHERLHEFFPGDLHQTKIIGSLQLDWEEFLGHALSLSVTPKPEDPRYPAFEADLRAHFDEYAHDGALDLPTACRIAAGRP